MADLTQTPQQVQIDLDAVEASNVGLDSVSDSSDTQATALKKTGVYALGASTASAPTTERAVMLTMARDTDAASELRHGQIVLTESGNLYFAEEVNGTLGNWNQVATLDGTQTLTNKALNGTLGATTPAAADVTTLDASGNVTADLNVNIGRAIRFDYGSGYVDALQQAGNDVYLDANAGVLYLRTSGNTLAATLSGANVSVAGALSKGSGSFRIDHPLKPDTHQLVHSFTESPQADLLYSGSVDLVDGKAEINIDTHHEMTEGTFEALCREIRIFTTNESNWEPIKGYVVGNILHISCQDATSSDSVSWLVIGERKDKHMFDTDWTDKDGRVIVEPEKVIPPEPTYVQRTITVEVEGETEIKTLKVAERVDFVNGVATLIPAEEVDVEAPKTEEVLVFNPDGSPAMVQA